MSKKNSRQLFGRVTLSESLPWKMQLLQFPPATGTNTSDKAPDFIAAELTATQAEDCYVAAIDLSASRDSSSTLTAEPGNPSRGCHLHVDCAAGKLVLSTDRLGSCPLYYCIQGQVLSYSTDIDWLCKEAGDPSMSPQAIYDYLHFHVIPAPGCIFSNIIRLRPGSSLTANRDGHTQVHYWWLPEFRRDASIEPSTLQRELRDCLRASVSRAMPARKKVGKPGEHEQVGAFLSGGLDSSTVAGYLAELTNDGPAQAFAMGFEAEGYDEMPFARLTAAHFGLKLHEYYVTPEDVVRTLPELAAAFDQPFGNSSALPAYFCARFAAENGIDLLLAGDGGDELFAGNERYLQHGSFERYRRVPRPLQSAIRRVLGFVPEGTSLGRRGRSFLRQADMPMPERLYFYSFLNQFDPATVFSDEVLARINPRAVDDNVRQVFDAPESGDQLDRMLFHDWQFTLADNDLRKVDQACSMAGVRVAYPMLDDKLMDLAARIPTDIKVENGELRKFYKESLRGWLPDATLSKSKHGFGLPFGVWMREHVPLQELAYDAISQLASRDLFRRSFLNTAVSQHRAGHAAYYGELVWMLTTFELWVAARD